MTTNAGSLFRRQQEVCWSINSISDLKSLSILTRQVAVEMKDEPSLKLE